jgi:hypothetical protein
MLVTMYQTKWYHILYDHILYMFIKESASNERTLRELQICLSIKDFMHFIPPLKGYQSKVSKA